MKTCKYSVTDKTSVDIELNMLERGGRKVTPFYNEDGDGEIRCYAVCRKCDNPVQLIGLYRDTHVSAKPFGKQVYPKNVSELADYNQDAYEFCPLADPNTSKSFPVRLKKAMDEEARQIYNTVRNQFDKVLYFLENDTGLSFSEKLAKELLRNYLGRRGWLYREARLDNIPWIFAYMTLQQTFYGRWIVGHVRKS